MSKEKKRQLGTNPVAKHVWKFFKDHEIPSKVSKRKRRHKKHKNAPIE